MSNEKNYFSNDEAANEILTVSPDTLRNSRSTGKLCGREAPPYIKAGRKVLYLKSDLLAWMERLPKFKNTSQEIMQEQA